MKNLFVLLIALVVMAFLFGYMCAFQLPFDQVAVVATFGKVKAPQYDKTGHMQNPGSLKFTSGLYVKWPWPVQSVKKYTTQVQILEGQPTEMQLADNNTVIISTYLAWKIEDPSAFYRSLSTIDNAQKQLRSSLHDVREVIQSYRLSDLVNNDPKQLEIREIEKNCADTIQKQLSAIKPGYGIKVVQFGIRRMVLPETVTASVFARMRSTREQLAQNAKSEGKAQALNITSRADAQKKRILAFANRQADALRTKGDREAAAYYGAFKKDQQFAIFLREIQSLQDMLKHNTTFIANAKDLSPHNLLKEGAPSLLASDPQVNGQGQKHAKAGK